MPRAASPIEDYYIVLASGCWQWIGGSSPNGKYGRYKYKGRMYPAHTFMYEKYKGKIPEGMEPDHLCKNTICVNPGHIEAVTHAENARRRGSTILDPIKVNEIKQMINQNITEEKIAQKYGVCRQTINNISRGLIWRDSNAL